MRVNKTKNKGFTLIELLIVIAILGVMAVIVFVLLNPGERQAQARDTGRISSVTQIGRAVEGYYSSRQGTYPDTSNWAQDLLDVGEISSFPSGISYTLSGTTNCTTFEQPAIDPTYCYDLDSTNGAIVFALAESERHTSKCTSPESAYFVFSTADGRGGIICSNGDPSPWASGTMTYVD